MAKILNIKTLEKELGNIKSRKVSIVLAGGCFDILHIGHIKFLKEAKSLGDKLMVFLESDEKVKKLKGENRPYFKQEERAGVLSSIGFIDYIILLPYLETDDSYRKIISKISPSVIAVTANDPIIKKKNIQAKLSGGKIVIIPYIKTFSSSGLAKLIGME